MATQSAADSATVQLHAEQVTNYNYQALLPTCFKGLSIGVTFP